FLGFLAASTAAMASACTASAQSRPGASRAAGSRAAASRPGTRPVPNEAPIAPRPRGGPSAPGITTSEIRVGMSAAFRGTAAGLGTEFYRGAQAYYDEVNVRGGVHGRTITVVALDDNYEPNPCIKNTIQLLEKDQVFTLSNYVGTPTLTRALPVVKRYAEQQV